MTAYRPRDIAPELLRALTSMPVVILTGLRQSGKTTFLQRQPQLRRRHYVTFDEFADLEAARQSPENLLAGDKQVTIDEVQKLPEILSLIKGLVDRRRRNGQFILSGSANLALLKNARESLAGRAISLTLNPFTRRELAGSKTPPFLPAFFNSLPLRHTSLGSAATFNFGDTSDLWRSCTQGAMPGPGGTQMFEPRHVASPITPKEVLLGGMPPVCLGLARDSHHWFKGYEQTYLSRDIQELSQIGDTVRFRHLLQLAALRTGQVLNQTQLGRDAKLNDVTTGRYLALMEASYVIARLPPFLSNRTSRLVKSPKLYFTDSGMAAHLAGITSLDTDEPSRGALIETYVAQNLAGLISSHWLNATLAYWTVSGRHEVDFVIEVGRDCIAIEVKAATRWDERDLAGLRAFLDATPRCRAAILAYNGTRSFRLGERLWALPLSLIMS